MPGKPQLDSPGRRRFLRCLVLCLLFLSPAAAPAQPISKEYQIKAVLLLRLAQFTGWPTNAFESTNSPIVIGVLGDAPFGTALDFAVQGETANGRPVVVQRFQRGDPIQNCHVLFVSASERLRAAEVVRSLGNQSTLTVADFEGFATQNGGMIRLLNTPDRKVGMRVNLAQVKAAGLTLDARLLRMAEIVGPR